MSGMITGASDVLCDGWEEVLSIEEKILSSPPQFKDVLTGEEIPNDRCLLICQELDKVHKKLQEGREIYKRVMRETHGSQAEKKAAASLASDKHVGGGRTQLWNRLCQNKIAISLVAEAPPAENTDVVWHNEKRLLIAIYQCDPTLEGLCQDIWTSPREIGTLSQTIIYARYPYHMGQRMKRGLLQGRLLMHMLVVAILRYGTGYARIRLPSHWLQQHPLLETMLRQGAMRGGYSLQYINVTQACRTCVKTYGQVSRRLAHCHRPTSMSGTHTIWV